MLAALNRPEPAIALALISAIYLLVTYLTLRRINHLEIKLIGLGLLTGLLGVWCGALIDSAGASAQVEGVGHLSVSAGEVTAVLGRLAVLLVLGGLAASLLPPSSSQKEVVSERPL